MTQVSEKRGTLAPEEGFEPTSARNLNPDCATQTDPPLNIPTVGNTNPVPPVTPAPRCAVADLFDAREREAAGPEFCDMLAGGEGARCMDRCFYAGLVAGGVAPSVAERGSARMRTRCAREGCRELYGNHIATRWGALCPALAPSTESLAIWDGVQPEAFVWPEGEPDELTPAERPGRPAPQSRGHLYERVPCQEPEFKLYACKRCGYRAFSANAGWPDESTDESRWGGGVCSGADVREEQAPPAPKLTRPGAHALAAMKTSELLRWAGDRESKQGDRRLAIELYRRANVLAGVAEEAARNCGVVHCPDCALFASIGEVHS